MTDGKLTILELTASGDTAGATRSIADLSLGLAKRGHRVILGARPQSHIYKSLEGQGVEVVPIPFQRKLSLADARSVAEVARDRGVNVVNSHASKDRYAAIMARLAYGMAAKVVVTRRVMPSSGGGALQAWFYVKGSDGIVAVSEAVKQALVRTGIPASHITTIPNGLPRGRFARRPVKDPELRMRLGIPSDLPVMGVVSRLKDQGDVLRALSHLPDPVAVLFVGIRRLRSLARLEEKMPKRHVVRYVEFAWDVLPYYGLLDVSILPSRIEGLSQTLLESMALGIPTIATRAGGNTDVIRHEENGLLYAPRDAADLAAQIRRALTDKALRERMRAEGLRTATEDFSFERTVKATEALYRSLAAARIDNGVMASAARAR